MEQEVVSACEASTMVGVTERTIRRWISQGKLHAPKEGGVFQIEVADLEAFLQERAPRVQRANRELEILQRIIQALESLDDQQQNRVLTFVTDRFDWIPPGS